MELYTKYGGLGQRKGHASFTVNSYCVLLHDICGDPVRMHA